MKIKLFFIILFYNIIFIIVKVEGKVPYIINYQGKLTEDGVVANGYKHIKFRIYDSLTRGTLLWESDVQNIYITNGLFNAYIGETTDVTSPQQFTNITWGNGDRYLEIQIDTITLSPREKLTSVVYAFLSRKSELAERADVATLAESIVDNSIDSKKLILDKHSLYKVSGGRMVSTNDMIGIGTTTPDATFQVNGSMKIFGIWQSRSADVVYHAETDGFVIVYSGSDYAISGYTDSNTNPTTVRCIVADGGDDAGDSNGTFTMPVRKGDYWKVTGRSIAAIYWLPLGN